MSFFGPIIGEFGPARVLFPDGDARIPAELVAEFAALTLLEHRPALLDAWERRLEACVGTSDAHRRALARAELLPFPGEAEEATGHTLTAPFDTLDAEERLRRCRVSQVRPVDEHLDWYLVRTATNREARAELALAEAGFAVYLPRLKRWRRNGRRKDRIEQALFGGYLFVGLLPGQSQRQVEKIDAVQGIVRFAGERFPTPLAFRNHRSADPDNPSIGLILDLELAGEFDRTRRDRRRDPAEGTRVEITHGHFKGWPAQFVARRDDDRIELVFQMLGRWSPLVIDPEDVALPGAEEL